MAGSIACRLAIQPGESQAAADLDACSKGWPGPRLNLPRQSEPANGLRHSLGPPVPPMPLSAIVPLPLCPGGMPR